MMTVAREKKLRKGEIEPDKGWSWIIAFACCYLSLVVSGIGRTSGVMFVEFIAIYGITRKEATFLFSLRACIRCLGGPIVGVIGHLYGVRKVTVIGGIIISIGSSLCYFTHDFFWVTVLWGGINGIGFCLCTTLVKVSVNQYFIKYRATASGIASSGACIGSFLMPIVIEVLFEKYGLRGTFLILGSLLLNIIPAGFLFRTPPWLKHKERVKHKKSQSKNKVPHGDTTASNKMEYNSMDLDKKNNSLSREKADPIKSNQICGTNTQEKDGLSCYRGTDPPPDVTLHTTVPVAKEIIKVPEICLCTQRLSNSAPSVVEVSKQSGNRLIVSLKILLNIIVDPIFLLISLTQAVWGLTFMTFITVIIDYASDRNVSETTAKYIISAFSIGDLFGRLCLGWITDKGFMTKSRFMVLNLLTISVSILIFPAVRNLYGFVGLSILYGIGEGSVLIMMAPLTAHYLKQEEQSHAMGCKCFLSGILSFAMPPLIGYFRDNVGNYDGVFYMLGSLCAICSFVWMLEPTMIKLIEKNHSLKRDHKQTRTDNDSTPECKTSK